MLIWFLMINWGKLKIVNFWGNLDVVYHHVGRWLVRTSYDVIKDSFSLDFHTRLIF